MWGYISGNFYFKQLMQWCFFAKSKLQHNTLILTLPNYLVYVFMWYFLRRFSAWTFRYSILTLIWKSYNWSWFSGLNETGNNLHLIRWYAYAITQNFAKHGKKCYLHFMWMCSKIFLCVLKLRTMVIVN